VIVPQIRTVIMVIEKILIMHVIFHKIAAARIVILKILIVLVVVPLIRTV
jgi:hypothetical protein